jgi:hypothetical protein
LRSIPIVRGWKFFTLVRRRSTSLGDTRPNILIAPLVTVRFDDRRHRAFAKETAANDASTLVHMLERQPPSRRTLAGVDVDHTASSWTPVSSISGIAPPTLLMNTSTHPSNCLVDGDLDTVGPRVRQQSPCRRVPDRPIDRHRRGSAPFV